MLEAFARVVWGHWDEWSCEERWRILQPEGNHRSITHCFHLAPQIGQCWRETDSFSKDECWVCVVAAVADGFMACIEKMEFLKM